MFDAISGTNVFLILCCLPLSYVLCNIRTSNTRSNIIVTSYKYLMRQMHLSYPTGKLDTPYRFLGAVGRLIRWKRRVYVWHKFRNLFRKLFSLGVIFTDSRINRPRSAVLRSCYLSAYETCSQSQMLDSDSALCAYQLYTLLQLPSAVYVHYEQYSRRLSIHQRATWWNVHRRQYMLSLWI